MTLDIQMSQHRSITNRAIQTDSTVSDFQDLCCFTEAEMASHLKSNRMLTDNWRRRRHTTESSQEISTQMLPCCPVLGQLVQLGIEGSIPSHSILKLSMTDIMGAPWGHPLVVISVDHHAGTVKCLQMTSQDVVAKTNNDAWPLRYVPVLHHLPWSDHDQQLADRGLPCSLAPKYRDSQLSFWHHPTLSQPFLELQDAKQMKERTCVNVEFELTIEWRYLQRIPSREHLILTDRSLARLKAIKRDHVPLQQLKELPWDNRESLDEFWQVDRMVSPNSPPLSWSSSSASSSSASTPTSTPPSSPGSSLVSTPASSPPSSPSSSIVSSPSPSPSPVTSVLMSPQPYRIGAFSRLKALKVKANMNT
ncbi:hypothetical protein BDV97DRAFT_157730 [Delphinella strobiligena]|nr:hypothetical protein BDV97DRAFT_157730 [Delphinella strobiligena]